MAKNGNDTEERHDTRPAQAENLLMLGPEPDYEGIFTRNQAPGAIENGAYIVKRNSEHGDATQEGESGIVLGSILIADSMRAAMAQESNANQAILSGSTHVYFIEWSNRPKVAIGVMGYKIRQY